MSKLFTRVIPRFEYHICIYYRTSENYYREHTDQIGGIR